jgi:hypothetical protein
MVAGIAEELRQLPGVRIDLVTSRGRATYAEVEESQPRWNAVLRKPISSSKLSCGSPRHVLLSDQTLDRLSLEPLPDPTFSSPTGAASRASLRSIDMYVNNMGVNLNLLRPTTPNFERPE